MRYNRKHLLLTVAAAFLILTAGIKEASGIEKVKNYPTLFSAHRSVVMVQNFADASICMLDNILNEITFSSLSFAKFNTHFHSLPVSDFILDNLRNRVPGYITLANTAMNRESAGSGDTLVQRFWERYTQASLKVRILVTIFFYLVFSIVVLFIVILVHRQIRTRQRNFTKKLRNEYQEQLAGFLFDDEVDTLSLRGVNKRTNRQVLIDEVMELHTNLHGEAAKKLKDLYFKLELHKDSLRKVDHRRWDIKAKGFGELAQMDVKDANTKIKHYINSKNPILRMQAQVAMVKLVEENPLGFLDDFKHEMSYWEQLNIHDTLVYHQIDIESYDQWLENKNASVVMFALRMIGLFKQVQSGEKVRELLFHENPEIALAAVQTMNSLELSEYIEDLKMLFKSETLKLVNILETQRKDKDEKDIKSLDDLLPRKIRYEIIQALQPIATANEVPFLEQVVLDSENSFRIRLLTINVMMSIKPQGEVKVNELLNTSSDEVVKKMIINVKQNQES